MRMRRTRLRTSNISPGWVARLSAVKAISSPIRLDTLESTDKYVWLHKIEGCGASTAPSDGFRSGLRQVAA
jgi:hypothetical protein